MTTAPAPARPGQPAPPTMSHLYFHPATGQRLASRIPVPVDSETMELTAKGFECPRRCTEIRWVALTFKGVPACKVHGVKMRPYTIRKPALLPYRELWNVCEKPLRPVWALPGMAALGATVDAAHIPALAVAGAVPLAFEAGRRVWREHRIRFYMNRPGQEMTRQEVLDKQRMRRAIDAAARKVGYGAAAGTSWLAAAAGLGIDPFTTAGKWMLTALLPVWALPAASWWFKQRHVPKPRPAEAVVEPAGPQMDADEVYVRRIWDTVLAVRSGDVVGVNRDGTPIKATQAGKLPGTVLEDWHKVVGGWAATIVGPIGAYESDQFAKSVGKIASAFSVKKSMVTVMADAEDENRSLVMIQKSSPISDIVRWAGPDSIDVEAGKAPVVQYADGTLGVYELYRPGWGVPHVAAFGTTGSGKSEFLNLLFTIDRWAHHVGDDGVAHGLVADFLIDPQQGQSFAPFLDELAAPVACSLEEAMVLVRALEQEGLRRNRYLAREAKTWDERRQKWRTGRKWWNPLVDGPILALTIDEAHDYLSNREFAALVTKAGRMWRKCGMQLRIGTHTPLLNDLGGSMALRDMLTGGYVWMGRTANSLSGPTAFNGRMPVDPRTIPAVAGLAYPLSALNPKAMLARTMWEPDFYDWVRDLDDNTIGYPAVLPAETLLAFGSDYAAWLERAEAEAAGGFVAPFVSDAGLTQAPTGDDLPDRLLKVLSTARVPLGMDEIEEALRRSGADVGTLRVREALKALRSADLVITHDRRHELTGQAVERLAADAEAGAA